MFLFSQASDAFTNGSTDVVYDFQQFNMNFVMNLDSLRMEFACLAFLVLLAVVYISARRTKTKLHRAFLAVMILAFVDLVFDVIITILETSGDQIGISGTNIWSTIYACVMIALFYHIHFFVQTLITEDYSNPKIANPIPDWILLGVLLVFEIFKPFQTQFDELWAKFSDGSMMSDCIYVGLALFVIASMIELFYSWKHVRFQRKFAITISLIIQMFVLFYQVFKSYSSINSIGIILIVMAFYISMDNPDVRLMEELRLEKERADAANASKTIFLANMSHEIRTPMNAIVGITDIMLRKQWPKEEEDYLLSIKNSGEALLTIINDVLDFNKIEAGKMELVCADYEPHQMLEDLKLIFTNRIGSKPVEMNYDIDANLPGILYGDGLRLRQTIINIVNNGIKYTDKGTVTLTIKASEPFAVDDEDGYYTDLFVEVKDTGVGIKKSDMKKLFESFQQVDTKRNYGREGTGLGLALSRNIIRLMGGDLEVKSQYGFGSTFYFTVRQKIVQQEIPAHENRVSHDALLDFTAKEARILIVDDNSMNLKVAVGLLEPLQMQIDVAKNGLEATKMVMLKHYDIVFMDHMMPIMDGVEATKVIRKAPDARIRNIPIIALTANAVGDVRQTFLDAGMNDMVTKPIHIEELATCLREYLPSEKIHERSKEDAFAIEQVIEQNATNKQTLPDNQTLTDVQSLTDAGIVKSVGIENSGSEKMWLEMLSDCYKIIDKKAKLIEDYLNDELIHDYTVEVHALKNTMRLIGHSSLSESFLELEQAGNQNNLDLIQDKTPIVLSEFRGLKEVLLPYRKNQSKQTEVPKDEMISILEELKNAVDTFDLDTADTCMQRLEECLVSETVATQIELLSAAVADVAMEEIMELCDKIKKQLDGE